MKKNNPKIDGRFWLTNNNEYFAGKGRIELLKYIKETGSISKAAKIMKMSYKAAWDSVDIMNKITGSELVARASGGKDGGGSKITEAGLNFIDKYEKYEKSFEKILSILEENPDIESILATFQFKSSADNIFHGTVSQITDGAIYSIIDIACDTFNIRASISKNSTNIMDLKVNDKVSALINSNNIIISWDNNINLSCSNKFNASVISIKKGAVSSEILMKIDDNNNLYAIVTNDSIADINLAYGSKITALFQAKDVILIKKN